MSWNPAEAPATRTREVKGPPASKLGGEDPVLASVRPGLLLLFLEDRLTGADDLLFIGKSLLRMFFAEYVEVGLVDCLGRIAKSEMLGHGAADEDKAALAVLEIDIVRNVFQEGMEEILHGTRSQLCGRAFVVRRHSVQTLIV